MNRILINCFKLLGILMKKLNIFLRELSSTAKRIRIPIFLRNIHLRIKVSLGIKKNKLRLRFNMAVKNMSSLLYKFNLEFLVIFALLPIKSMPSFSILRSLLKNRYLLDKSKTKVFKKPNFGASSNLAQML